MASDRDHTLELDYRKLFESLPGRYSILATDMTYLAATDAYLRATMKDRESLIGRTVFEAFPVNPDDPTAESQRIFRASFERVLATREPDVMPAFQYDIPATDGPSFEQRYWEPINTPILDADGNVAYVVNWIDDVTALEASTRIQAQIRAQNAELEARVAERTKELEATNMELEAFSYSVSHDLRAPLRAVDGFSHVLAERYQETLDEKGRHYLTLIREAGQRMSRLIDDLLKLSRVTQAELHRGTVDLSALAGSVVDELRRGEPDREAEVTIAPGLTANGDPALLRVVLDNLLANAWKFTSKKDHVIIEVGETEVEGKRAFFVRDNGAGFDPAYGFKLFGAFQRLHSTSEFDGTGIGLATVRRVIHRHGGTAWAEGVVNQGATVFFTLDSH